MPSLKAMEHYKAGDILTFEGSNDKHLFILYQGELGIYKGDLLLTTVNEKGAVLGEMGAILNHPRTATIKAMSDSTVVNMEFDLEEIIKTQPDLALKIIRSLAERLMILTEDYRHLMQLTTIENESFFNA